MQPEFSRPTRMPLEARRLHLVATPAECAALALRFSILGIARFTADLALTPETGGALRVAGRLEAEVRQECVVSLDPVVQRIAASIVLRVLNEGEMPADVDPESPDEIESHKGMVDLGEACAEQLALALDPYPRHPDAALPAALMPPPEIVETTAPAPERKVHPFAALAQRKRP